MEFSTQHIFATIMFRYYIFISFEFRIQAQCAMCTCDKYFQVSFNDPVLELHLIMSKYLRIAVFVYLLYYSEKIFILIWIWFCILFFVTTFDALYWFRQFEFVNLPILYPRFIYQAFPSFTGFKFSSLYTRKCLEIHKVLSQRSLSICAKAFRSIYNSFLPY